MNKKQLAAALSTALVVGAVGGATFTAKAAPSALPTSTFTLVNTKLVREPLADGGVQWNARSCAYETRDNVRLGEPCWAATLPGALVAPLEQGILDQKK